MAVESTTKISGLNASWPLGTDLKSEGDNHLRLIKSTLQACFDDSGATMKTALPLQLLGGAQPVGTTITTVATSSGTYTKPAGLVSLEVWVVGGGGGGGAGLASAAGQASAGAGGGAGGIVHLVYQASGLAATVSYTVGAAGAPGAGGPGGSGGNSSFSGMTANGGSGGNYQASSAGVGNVCGGGSGGTGSGGLLNLQGGDGQMGIANPHNRVGTFIQGAGGGNMFSAPASTALLGGVAAGSAGRFPGGGGMGSAVGGTTGSNTNGGAGAAGCIIFKERY